MTNARRLLWSPASQQDLLGIHRYYARVASSEVADNLLLEIDADTSRIKGEPFMGPSRDEILPGLRVIYVHPYSVFYRVKSDEVEISRVIHEKREPPSADSF